jgi:hypothetical protein
LHAYPDELKPVHETTVPATLHEPVPEIARVWQVPASAPDGITQLPLQHWAESVQVSWRWRQNEPPALHVPLVQSCEQHWVLLVQVSPEDVHVPLLIAWQVPEHLPVQHSVFDEHAVPSALQALAWQRWLTPQKPEQQSLLTWHTVVEPVAMHGPLRLPHWASTK